MAAVPYGRRARRFANPGISGLPADSLPANKLPYIQNMRSYRPGTLQPRAGTNEVTSTTFPHAIHSLARLNDQTPFATNPALRLVGNGTVLWSEAVGTPTSAALLDSGYSGNPLTVVEAAPPQSPRPYAYVADSSRQRKVNSDGVLYPIGLTQPLAPPAAALAAPLLTTVSDVNASGAWSAAGSVASAPSTVVRINTTIGTILYDSGASGYASISPAAGANFTAGTKVILAAAETVLVDEVIPPVATTSISQIVYDSGTSGLCWIQPLASLGTGILDPVPNADYLLRQNAGDYTVALQPGDVAGPLEFGIPPEPPLAAPVPRTRVVDFPVNGLVTLGGATETVRILAVAVGPDGIQAFRCSTASTHAGGDSITGLLTFRAFTTGTRAAGNTVTESCVQNILTPSVPAGQSIVTFVGGIQGTFAVNGSLIGGRATLADDVLHLSVKVDQLTLVNTIRIYLDVDASANDFLHNYYMAEWRASDIVAAIQGTNAADVSSVTDALPTSVVNNQVDPGPGNGGKTDSPTA